MSMTIEEWLKSGKYLPDFMQDFHDQKDLFKMLNEVCQNADKKCRERGEPPQFDNNITWVTAHIYTVDIFLWMMAKHGYTLQRSRKKFEFADIYERVADFKRRSLESMSRLLFGDKTV